MDQPLNPVEVRYKKVCACVHSFKDIHKREFPKREAIVRPWLRESTISLLYSARNVGKSWFALSLARAVCKGENFGPWGTSPRNVLYVDGESPGDDLKSRHALLGPYEGENADFLYLSSEDLVDIGVVNLNELEWRDCVERLCKEHAIKLLILDNLFSLVAGIDYNDMSKWGIINAWLMKMRRRGLAVLMLHHAGKDLSRGPLGTSTLEANIDNSISLTRPRGYRMEEGCRFVHEFTKNRTPHESIPMLEKLDWKLIPDERGTMVWTIGEVGEREAEKGKELLKLYEEGTTKQEELARTLGVKQSAVSKQRKQLIEEGLLREDNQVTVGGRKWLEEKSD